MTSDPRDYAVEEILRDGGSIHVRANPARRPPAAARSLPAPDCALGVLPVLRRQAETHRLGARPVHAARLRPRKSPWWPPCSRTERSGSSGSAATPCCPASRPPRRWRSPLPTSTRAAASARCCCAREPRRRGRRPVRTGRCHPDENTLEELFDVAALLSTQPVLRAGASAWVTNAGGPGIPAGRRMRGSWSGAPRPVVRHARDVAHLPSRARGLANPIDLTASGTPEHTRTRSRPSAPITRSTRSSSSTSRRS